MPTLIAMVGLPRSGKSTIAKKLSKSLHAPIVNRDCIRIALHGSVYEESAEPMTRAIYKIMIESLFRAGHEWVIADETHYSQAARDFVKKRGWWDTKFYVVPTPSDVCIERAIETNQPWLPPVISQMARRWEPLGPDDHVITDEEIYGKEK